MQTDRITELEIRFSHQDRFIQELNEMVVVQEQRIAQLEKAIIDLKRSVNSEGGVSPTRSLQDDKPPHY